MSNLDKLRAFKLFSQQDICTTQQFNYINKIMNKIPYKEGYNSTLYKKGALLMQPVINYFKSKNNYNYSNHKKLINLDKAKNGSVMISGIISGYRIVCNINYKQALLFLCLKHVLGKINHKITYVSNHLWISPNLTNQILPMSTEGIGIGDVVLVSGKLHRYQSRTKGINQLKTSLNSSSTLFYGGGYPKLIDGKYQFSFVPYKHGWHSLYYQNVKAGKIYLGHEISRRDRNFIKKHHLHLFDEFTNIINHDVRKGLLLNNSKVLVFLKNSHSLQWKSCNHKNCIIIVTAKDVKNNLYNTEKEVYYFCQKHHLRERINQSRLKINQEINKEAYKISMLNTIFK